MIFNNRNVYFKLVDNLFSLNRVRHSASNPILYKRYIEEMANLFKEIDELKNEIPPHH